MNRKYAFTLAEVLITLAVIGVVAALTIPSVVTNYRNKQTTAQLKKTFSALANTTNMAIADNGPIIDWKIGNHTNGEAAADFADTYIVPYLKILKNCRNSTSGDCQYQTYRMNGIETSITNSSCAKFYLNDGTLISIVLNNSLSDGKYYKRADIYVDVNGKKSPNIYGKDIFFLQYVLISENKTVGKFAPTGIEKTTITSLLNSSNYSCNKTASGEYCAAAIMKNNWQIPTRKEYVKLGGNANNYPW